MQNLKKLFFVALVFTLAAVGCKKTDDNTGGDNPPDESGTCYVNKIDDGSDGYNTISYNSDHLISSIVDYDSTGTASGNVTSFTYNGTKLLTMISTDNGTVDVKFEYKYGSASTPDSLVVWENDGNGSLKKSGVYGLTYSGDKLVKTEMQYSYMGQSFIVSKNEYAYSGDNLSEITSYKFSVTSMQLELEGTATYEYDSKKSPFHGIGLDYFFINTDKPFMSVNNVTKCTFKDASGTVDQSKSFTNAIEYNSNNYPTKITTNYNDGSKTNVELYTYDCK